MAAGLSPMRGGVLFNITDVPEGERIRIGPPLVKSGGPPGAPATLPGKPPRVPIPTPEARRKPGWEDAYNKAVADQQLKTQHWVAAFMSAVYSYFDFFARFTLDGQTVAEKVRITDAFSQQVEPMPTGTGSHVSGGFDPAGLQDALDDAKKRGEDDPPVKWNDLHDIEIKRKPGTAGTPPTPPAPKPNETPEEKDKRLRAEEIKKAVEAIKEGRLDSDGFRIVPKGSGK